MLVSVRERSAFIMQYDTLVAIFGRYTDLLSADMGGAYYIQWRINSKFYGMSDIHPKGTVR